MHRNARIITVSLLLALLAGVIHARKVDHTRWVNPFIGTGGHGHTFPGATVPFGMVQLSPDTRIDNWDGSSGYHYSDDVIYGFSHTHLSGTGIPDGCDILFMPMLGGPQYFGKPGDYPLNGYASKFSHSSEVASPGYYKVKLEDDGIIAELTATKRVGFHRYSIPRSDFVNIVLDLAWRDSVIDAKLKIVNDRRIEGSRFSTSWAKNQRIYFVAEFSEPFLDGTAPRYGRHVPVDQVPTLEADYFEAAPRSFGRERVKAAFRFNASYVKPILVKVAISHVSIEGARKNLEAELPHWDFDKVRADAKAAWNKELSKIEVSGGTPEQTTNFYTALYHTMIHPNVFNDVDGRYKGHDGKIHQLPGYESVSSPHVDKGSVRNPKRRPERNQRKSTTPSAEAASTPPIQEGSLGGRRNRKSKIENRKSEHYTVFSLWDTFRAAHPLYTIIDQKRTVDFINTFIRIYEQGGRLPVWELWGEETDTMIGYHAVSVIADAMAKGIKGFDYEKAYQAAKHSAELDHHGLAAYKRRGYISMEDEQESVSKTLEYAYNDWCIAEMAMILHTERLNQIVKASTSSSAEKTRKAIEADPKIQAFDADYVLYSRRAQHFENLFDPSTGFFRPKQNGGFVRPFEPNEVTFHFTEGNSWQYSFFVPHDVSRLMELMGGREKLAAKLDELFTTGQKLAGRDQPDITGLIGQYAHGNEPSHHIAYLYNYAGQPGKTQKYVRRIMDEFYKPTPDGLIGNEDCGQMSAWYVLSASGFYPVLPGQARYDLGTPLFKKVTYHLENGKKFIIRAPKVSPANIYINSAKWNVAPHEWSYIAHEQIMSGGVLELDMSDKPNDRAFSSYWSSTEAQGFVAVPLIDGGGRVFRDKTTVALSTTTKNARIRYTINSSDLKDYIAPFTIDQTSVIRAFSINSAGGSMTAEAMFLKKPNDWTVQLFSKYSRQYTGGGDEGLIDGIRGTTNFASGEWQGYQGQDFVAVIDLQRETDIREVGGSFLQVARSWIWMPTLIEFEVSDDNRTFLKVAEIKTDVSPMAMTPTIREYVRSIQPVRTRYVRVTAKNLGKIPAWHPGAGSHAYIFVDEIIIR